MPSEQPTAVRLAAWGALRNNQPVQLATLENPALRVRLTNYGARLVGIEAPDRDGRRADILLGYDDIAGYEADKSFFGAVVGRVANRIARGAFTLGGKQFHVPINNGPNALHGGPEGFSTRIWRMTRIPNGVLLEYTSPDGEMGFPGKLEASVAYTLEADTLRMEYTATTDAPTVVCMTNHAYFNLTGDPSGTVLDHRLTLHAGRYTPIDTTLIPTGDLPPVSGTPFDFTTSHAIGDRINTTDEQLARAGGYDHNFVLADTPRPQPQLAAEALDPQSGRTLRVHTTEPGVQFYSGNFLDGTVAGKNAIKYPKRSGFCLETQHFPDTPNHPSFPSITLRPGETLRSTTLFTFGAAA